MASQTSGASGLSGRYASALFDLADEAKALDQVSGDLTDLGSMIADSADLAHLLSSPVISRDDQAASLVEIAKKAEFAELTQNFIGVVVANGRAFALPDIVKAFQAILAARRGEVTAEVVSAKALSDAQTSEIADQLKQAVGSPVALEAKVDPSLLGGLVVKLGSRMIDTSLKSKLQQLRLAMKGVA